jgi:hypothetical protein
MNGKNRINWVNLEKLYEEDTDFSIEITKKTEKQIVRLISIEKMEELPEF